MINFAAYFMVHFIINLRLFVAMMGSLFFECGDYVATKMKFLKRRRTSEIPLFIGVSEVSWGRCVAEVLILYAMI